MDLDRLVEFARDLVRRPSLSCEEGVVVQRVLEEMTTLGYDEVSMDDHGSAIGIVQGTEPGPTLLFDAHTDTVDVVGGVPWERDPFSGDVVDGFLLGRGSADMKGALAAMVHAAGRVDKNGIRGRVVVSASPMEEVLEGVALREVMKSYPPDFVVIGEATNLNLARGGRGRAEIHLEALGVPTHSSAPHLGRNAVLDMMRVIQGLGTVDLPTDSLMGPAILALTEISSAPFPSNSVIPSVCRATYDRRLLPGETEGDVLAPILETAESEGVELRAEVGMGEYTAFTGVSLRQEKFFPAWLFDENHWLVERALAGLRKSGLNPVLRTYQFCTNAAYSAGVAGIPTVGFGPAQETDAHVVNEKLRLEDLQAAADGYVGIMESVLAP